jgi:hypothetical protein
MSDVWRKVVQMERPPHREPTSNRSAAMAMFRGLLHWEQANWWIGFIPSVPGAILMAAGELGLAEVCLGITSAILVANIFARRWHPLAKFWLIVMTVGISIPIILTVDYHRFQQKLNAPEGDLVKQMRP